MAGHSSIIIELILTFLGAKHFYSFPSLRLSPISLKIIFQTLFRTYVYIYHHVFLIKGPRVQAYPPMKTSFTTQSIQAQPLLQGRDFRVCQSKLHQFTNIMINKMIIWQISSILINVEYDPNGMQQCNGIIIHATC